MRLTPKTALERSLAFLLDDDRQKEIGVAVSGGSDSLALLVLAHDWAVENGFRIYAATVDHGLRAHAKTEIAHVKDICSDLAIPHDTLVWRDWDGAGNLQAQARSARYDLLDDWSAGRNLTTVLVGHTADDQAETVLMNLARGSGVDGLAGMPEQGVGIVRPVLSVSRDDLRGVLEDRAIKWFDDPSNDDTRFERVKVRKMMGQLADLGLTRARIVQTADHMRAAKHSLKETVAAFATEHVVAQAGDLLIPLKTFQTVDQDTSARVISGALMWIGGHDYRPRYAAMCDMAQAVTIGQVRTLSGVRISLTDDTVRLSREQAAVDDAPMPLDAVRETSLWDHRWIVEPDLTLQADPTWTQKMRRALGPETEMQQKDTSNLTIRPLGDHIEQLPDWSAAGLPIMSLPATPAVFDGDMLIAAPVAGLQNGFSARIVADFTSFLLSR